MAAPEFTENGIAIQTFDEIFEELADGYRAIYGSDIDLSQDSADGQRVGIEAKARHDIQQLAVSIYNGLDVDLSADVSLKSILKLAGITVRPASQSQWDLTIATDRDVNLPDDYTVEDEVGQRWIITGGVTLSAGVSDVSFVSEIFGAVIGSAGASLSQVTIELGVTSITAAGSALLGVNEETDPEAKARRKLSVRNPSYSLIGGLYAKMANLAGVTGLEIYENKTDVHDVDLDLAAHSYWVVIEGGSLPEIAEIMAKQKTGGTGEKGTLSGVWLETLVRPNGSEIQKSHTANFDRPTLAPLYIKANASRRTPTIPIDTGAIESAIAKRTFEIGENIIASSLYADAYAAGNNFYLTDLLVSSDNITFVDDRLISGYADKFDIDIANVTITEV